MSETVLDTRDLSMRFGGVQAVNNVNFSLAHAAPSPRARRLPAAHARALAPRAPAAERGQEAARQEQDDEDQDRAEDERVVDQRLLAEQQL